MPKLRLEARAVVVVVALTACQAPERLVCSPVGPAVDMTVHDSVTNAPAATGARGAAELAGNIDSLMVNGPERMISHEWAKAGTYTVRIEKAGYQPWSAILTAPPGGVCGTSGVHAEARLQPVAQP